MRKAWTLAAAALTMTGMAVTGPAEAAGGNASAAKRCQTEFATLRGERGETFRNRGQCTSYAARGGRFAPAPIGLLLTYSPLFEPGVTFVTIDVSGSTGDNVRLREVIDGFVLDVVVPASTFPLEQTWACSATGSVTVTNTTTGATATAPFAPPPEACTGEIGVPD